MSPLHKRFQHLQQEEILPKLIFMRPILSRELLKSKITGRPRLRRKTKTFIQNSSKLNIKMLVLQKGHKGMMGWVYSNIPENRRKRWCSYLGDHLSLSSADRTLFQK